MALLDFSTPVAKWLVDTGVCDEGCTSPLTENGAVRVRLDSDASASLVRGKARHRSGPGGPCRRRAFQTGRGTERAAPLCTAR